MPGIAEDVINDMKKKGKCPPGEEMVDGKCLELLTDTLRMKKKDYGKDPVKPIPPGNLRLGRPMPGKPKIKEL